MFSRNSKDFQGFPRNYCRFAAVAVKPGWAAPRESRGGFSSLIANVKRLCVGIGDRITLAVDAPVRSARYRCQECGHPDIQVLRLEDVEGSLECLCSNCHVLRARWRGT